MFSHELFKYFNCEQSSLLHRRSKEIILEKGDQLFLQGARGEYVFFVNSGTLKIIKTSVSGAEKIFSIYQDNQFVALSILFNIPNQYPASGIAVEKTRVTAIPIAVLENAI
ncbi:MAG: Crp/Fnr family transcriptional regulator, partial [Turicibacter sp.]